MPGINVYEDRTINSFEELASLVQPFRKDGEWIFRGVRQSTYELIPKIGRPESRKGLGSGQNLPYVRAAEETMTRHFIRSAGPYVKHIPATRLEWLALAQHHGMFTRLLDWSESLLVAGYFAVEDARNREWPPMIYCVRDIPLAPTDKHDKLDELDEVMLYYPPHISPRIPAQTGLFTVHKNPDKPFIPNKVYLRIEIETALQRVIPVIPVLAQGASMPREKDLPPSLQPFAYRNAIAVCPDPDFRADMDRLIKGIQTHLGISR